MGINHDAKMIESLRDFNREHTKRFGLLRQRLDDSPFSLSEARLLYELAQTVSVTGAELARTLDLDPAQVSRTVKRFINQGLVDASPDPSHAKQRLLSLTALGRAAFASLEKNTQASISRLLDPLTLYQRERLLEATKSISEIFATTEVKPSLRDLKPGDLGLVVSRQAILYASEYGWNAEYEALVARILADFQQSFDPSRDAAWIADVDGQMVGSIFLAHSDSPDVGKLRLLFVEPDARGMGIGQMLVASCIAKARAVGYTRLDLWTNNVLVAARRIYERVGFRLVDEKAHRSFGQDLVGQTWALDLNS